MFIRAPKANALLAISLKEIRDFGYSPTDEEIVWLADFCAAHVGCRDSRDIAFLAHAHVVDGLILFPPTVQAQLFWGTDAAKSVRAISGFWATALDGYVLAHANTQGVFEMLVDARVVRSQVMRWIRRVPTTMPRLRAAISEVLGGDVLEVRYACERTGQDATSYDYGGYVAAVCVAAKMSPADVMRLTCDDATRLFSAAMRERGIDPDNDAASTFHELRAAIETLKSKAGKNG